MKNLKLTVIGIILFLAGTSQAQVSVNVNIGAPPMWGPVGYTDVQYYYLPDVEAYYDVPTANFIYLERGTWVHRTYLPTRYRNYDLYGGYKVVMNDYHGNRPYTHFNDYRVKYKKGYRGHEQHNIGERPGRGNQKSYSGSRPGRNASYSPGRSQNQNRNVSRSRNEGHGNDNGNRNGNGKNKGGDRGNGGGKHK